MHAAGAHGVVWLVVTLGVWLGAHALVSADEPASDALALMRAAESRRVEMLARLMPSAVCIFPDRAASGGGSGVIIDPQGYGLTNFHVIAPCLETRRGYGGLADGRLYPLEVLGVDPGGDIAMFKLAGREHFDHAALGDADELQLGQWVAALGNPFGLAEDFVPSVTLGVVSGLHRYQYGQGNLLEYADCIQVSTSINPGNSGGAVIDMQGRVVGIAGRGSFEERGRVNVGLGYAVTTNQIRRFLPALRAGRLCWHGTLGATVQNVGDELIFGAVQGLSPAERGGVELGDVLLAVNGRVVRTPNDYNNAIAILPADWPVVLKLRRGERELEVRMRLERLPLREMPMLIPDRAQNLAEVRRVFEHYARDDRGNLARCNEVAFEVEVTAAADARRGTVVLRRDEEGSVTFSLQDADDGGAWPAPIVAAGREWGRLIGPLVWTPRVGDGWEALGGDEIDGRIIAVVERRLESGRRLRWMFDLDSHELVQAAAGREQAVELAVWKLAERREFGGSRWPAAWRRAAGEQGGDVELRVREVKPKSTLTDVDQGGDA